MTGPTSRPLQITAYDFFFTINGLDGDNPTITVNQGDIINVTMTNLGNRSHEFFVLSMDNFTKYTTAIELNEEMPEPLPIFLHGSVEDVDSNSTESSSFIVNQAGKFMYACLDNDGTAPLIHANKGMFGNFTVLNPLEALVGKVGGLNIPLFVFFQAYLVAALVIIVILTGDREEGKQPSGNN
jgi:hypothetical protein